MESLQKIVQRFFFLRNHIEGALVCWICLFVEKKATKQSSAVFSFMHYVFYFASIEGILSIFIIRKIKRYYFILDHAQLIIA